MGEIIYRVLLAASGGLLGFLCALWLGWWGILLAAPAWALVGWLGTWVYFAFFAGAGSAPGAPRR